VHVVGFTVSATFSEKYSPPASGPAFAVHLELPGQPLTANLEFRAGEPSASFTSVLSPVEVTSTSDPWVLWVEHDVAPQAIRTAGGLLQPDALEDLWLSFTYEVAS
jgi:hypothetical protein